MKGYSDYNSYVTNTNSEVEINVVHIKVYQLCSCTTENNF